MKYKMCLLAMVLIVLITGFFASLLEAPEIICEKDKCCADKNKNKVCDPEDPIIESPTPPGRAQRWVGFF